MQRKVCLDPLEQLAEVEPADIFFDLSLGEIQVAFEHALHVVDILVQAVEFRPVAGECQLQAKAGEDGAQVVADAGQHGRALFHLALDALAHQDKGEAGAADFVGAAR